MSKNIIFLPSDEPEVVNAYLDLITNTTGTEPCYDPSIENPDAMGELNSDLWVEGWANRNISKQTAEEMCAGCDVLEKCKTYALLAREPYGIWGGTRARDRM